MDENLRNARIDYYQSLIADFNAGGGDDLSATELESRKMTQALIDALKATEAMPDAPAAPAELTSQIELRNYMTAFYAQSELTGPEVELRQELGDSNEHFLVPLQALEVRVDANTTIAAGTMQSNLQPVILPVFANSDLAHLGSSCV